MLVMVNIDSCCRLHRQARQYIRTCCSQLPEPNLPPGGVTSSQLHDRGEDGDEGLLLGEGEDEGEGEGEDGLLLDVPSSQLYACSTVSPGSSRLSQLARQSTLGSNLRDAETVRRLQHQNVHAAGPPCHVRHVELLRP